MRQTCWLSQLKEAETGEPTLFSFIDLIPHFVPRKVPVLQLTGIQSNDQRRNSGNDWAGVQVDIDHFVPPRQLEIFDRAIEAADSRRVDYQPINATN